MRIKIAAAMTISLLILVPMTTGGTAPKSNTNDLKTAIGLMGKNQFRRAIPCLDRVIEREPKSADAYYLRGSAYFGLETLKLAEHDLDMAIALNPGYAHAHFKKAQVFGEQGNFKLALKESDKAIALAGNKSDTGWFQDRAAWFDQDGNNSQAIEEYGKAIHASPSNIWAYYFRASQYFKLGKYDKALADLNIACTNKSDSGYGRFCELRAKCLDKLGQHSLAEKDRKSSKAEALKRFDDFQFGPSTK